MGYNNPTILPVDKARFKEVLKAKKVEMKQISLELGHDPVYVSGYISKSGGLPKFIVQYLQKWYEIPYSAYEPAKEAPEEEPKQAEAVDVDVLVKALKEAILTYNGQQAIGRTVRFVLGEEATQDMIKKLIKEALQEQIG